MKVCLGFLLVSFGVGWLSAEDLNTSDSTTKKSPYERHQKLRDKKPKISYLSWQGYTVTIPSSCVLYIPDHLKERVTYHRGDGKLSSFPSFYSQNKSWISVYKLSNLQVLGREKLNFEKLEAFKKNGTVLISVYNDNPLGLGPDVLKYVTTPESEEKL